MKMKKTGKKIAFLLYPTSKVKVGEDSSFWIMHELLSRGHEVHHFESRHLFAENGTPKARLYPTRTDAKKGFIAAALSAKPALLQDFDAIFIRKEPPFDDAYLHAMQLLELLRGKTFLVNDPRGITMFNEKLSILNFPRHIPETLVTEDPAIAREFIRKLGGGKAVVKPLNEKAGSGILFTSARDKNLPSLLDVVTGFSKNKIIVQRFIHAKKLMDKRILVLNGEILGSFARKPASTDFRSNLSVGGSMHAAAPTASDRAVVAAVAPTLIKNGLYFTGIDVMDRYLTEINVTSPSGIPEINALYGLKVQKKIADFIEARI